MDVAVAAAAGVVEVAGDAAVDCVDVVEGVVGVDVEGDDAVDDGDDFGGAAGGAAGAPVVADRPDQIR